MRLTEAQLQRLFNDRNYWGTVAAQIIAEAQAHTGSGVGLSSSSPDPDRMKGSRPLRVKASDEPGRVLKRNAELQVERVKRKLQQAGLPVETSQEMILESLDPGERKKLLLPRGSVDADPPKKILVRKLDRGPGEIQENYSSGHDLGTPELQRAVRTMVRRTLENRR